mmetsp:Transcript_46020/g.115861  ORF Transcript_46020/g.115861 Transcript_46020/m.115861 type:complete len:201 (-) Transcript_46020:364-966(-)
MPRSSSVPVMPRSQSNTDTVRPSSPMMPSNVSFQEGSSVFLMVFVFFDAELPNLTFAYGSLLPLESAAISWRAPIMRTLNLRFPKRSHSTSGYTITFSPFGKTSSRIGPAGPAAALAAVAAAADTRKTCTWGRVGRCTRTTPPAHRSSPYSHSSRSCIRPRSTSLNTHLSSSAVASSIHSSSRRCTRSPRLCGRMCIRPR